MGLKGKVAYITGGTKGIGFATAKVLIAAGMKVAISGRTQDAVTNAAKALGDGSSVLAIASDVSVLRMETAAVKQILEKWGQLDVVIANAGVGHFSSVETLTEEHWNQMINTNLTGAFFTLKASLDALKKSEGYYMTIASLAGANFFAKGSGYNATKFGVVGFTQAAMLDLRKYGIKVSTIMPGSVSTNFNNNEPSDKDAWKIQPQDIGTLVLDLLQMNPRTLPSKVEVRPTRPDLK